MLKEFLSRARDDFYYFSSIEIYGFPLDILLHFIGGAIIYYFCIKKYAESKSFLILTGFILFKELVDVFAHSELRYIQNPKMDTFWDVVASYAGGAVVYLAMLRKRKTTGQDSQ
jgi:hypothetical protein